MKKTESRSVAWHSCMETGCDPIHAVRHDGNSLLIDKFLELTLQGLTEDNDTRDTPQDDFHIYLHEPRAAEKPLSEIPSMQVKNDMTAYQIYRPDQQTVA